MPKKFPALDDDRRRRGAPFVARASRVDQRTEDQLAMAITSNVPRLRHHAHHLEQKIRGSSRKRAYTTASVIAKNGGTDKEATPVFGGRGELLQVTGDGVEDGQDSPARLAVHAAPVVAVEEEDVE
jgi:hypothetical protein